MMKYMGLVTGLMLADLRWVGEPSWMNARMTASSSSRGSGAQLSRGWNGLHDQFQAIPQTERPFSNDRSGSQRGHYVQCLFFDNDTKLLCEAASGYYDRPNRSRLSDEALATLQLLGFDMDDSQGNFIARLDAAQAGDLTKAAELMLSALYDAYGSHRATSLEFYAPLIKNSA